MANELSLAIQVAMAGYESSVHSGRASATGASTQIKTVVRINSDSPVPVNLGSLQTFSNYAVIVIRNLGPSLIVATKGSDPGYSYTLVPIGLASIITIDIANGLDLSGTGPAEVFAVSIPDPT